MQMSHTADCMGARTNRTIVKSSGNELDVNTLAKSGYYKSSQGL